MAKWYQMYVNQLYLKEFWLWWWYRIWRRAFCKVPFRIFFTFYAHILIFSYVWTIFWSKIYDVYKLVFGEANENPHQLNPFWKYWVPKSAVASILGATPPFSEPSQKPPNWVIATKLVIWPSGVRVITATLLWYPGSDLGWGHLPIPRVNRE